MMSEESVKTRKRQMFEAAGFRVGTVQEFLGLSDAEMARIERKLARVLAEREEDAGLARRLQRAKKRDGGGAGISLAEMKRRLGTAGGRRKHAAGRRGREFPCRATRNSKTAR